MVCCCRNVLQGLNSIHEVISYRLDIGHSLFTLSLDSRQLLRLPDGGTISLDVYPPFEGPDDDTPILFVLHGLTGTTQESYTRATVKEITRSKVETGTGFRVVALNFRGCESWLEQPCSLSGFHRFTRL
jgi:predicted alpha/beta-fold hydrolase